MTRTISDAFLLNEYRQLGSRLKLLREQNHWAETAEEDSILDEMDTIWYKLSDEAHSILSSEKTF